MIYHIILEITRNFIITLIKYAKHLILENVDLMMQSTRYDLSLSSINFRFYPLKQDYNIGWKDKSADDETRKYSDKLRDVCALAERLGCSFGQLAIAWSLKNESVQCLLLGASNIDQLYESLQSLQVTIRLFTFRKAIWIYDI